MHVQKEASLPRDAGLQAWGTETGFPEVWMQGARGHAWGKTLYKWETSVAPPCSPLRALSACFSFVASITLVITCLASVCFSELHALSTGLVRGWVPSTEQPAWGVINVCWENKQTDAWLAE